MKSSTGKLEHNGKMAQNLDICTLLYHPEQRKVSPRNIATQLFQDNKNFTLRQSFSVSYSIFPGKDSA